MNKFTVTFLLFLLSFSLVEGQQMKDPKTAKSPSELELIFKDNFVIQQRLVQAKAAELNIPLREVLNNGVEREFVAISKTGMPIYYHTTNNVDAAKTISTNKLWPAGGLGLSLTGSGMTNRLAVWDGGKTRTTHQEFQGRATQADGASTFSDHATHVSGTMAAGGVVANAKGMSYQAPIKCYDWNSDASEMSSAASAGLLVSNHSYTQISGWQYNNNRWEFWGDPSVSTLEDYKYGFYDGISEQWDQIALSYPNYLICIAAGNDRNEPGTIPATYYIRNTSGVWVLGSTSNPPSTVGPYNSISGGPGNAKNVLTVGAVNKITTGWTKSSDVVMSSFSGWGPTDDGRIKPDVVANGVSVNSCISTSDAAYATYNGTSMASPNASGSALLLQQHYQNTKGTFMRASTLKGLIIHTADEAGAAVGPDYTFGWGLMNTAKAAGVITDSVKNTIFQNTHASSATYTYTFFSDGVTPIRATICWTDRPGNGPNPSLNPTIKMLVNDLDLRIKRNADNQVFMPYVLNVMSPTSIATTGDNTIDNVEQVFIAAPPAGTYTITVTGKGGMVGGSQAYSLIISGITPKPQAGFTSTNRVVCSLRSVTFADQSSGATNRMWYFPGGSPSQSTATNPTVTYNLPGVYPVALRISSSSGYDSIYRDDYVRVGGLGLPFEESFEPNSATRSLWTIDNLNSDTTWRYWTIGGNTPGNTAIGINNYDWPRLNALDRLNSPIIDLKGYQNAVLEFQHAYTRFDSASTDSLIIYISTNCGTNYIRLAGYGEKGQGTFATAPAPNYYSASKFIPSTSIDWCGDSINMCLSVNLTPYVGNNNIRIRFEQKSNNGNNMYLDNIKITGVPNVPVANFYSLTKTVCVGDEVQLLDSSRNKPSEWEWAVTDADTVNYTIMNPKINFTSSGLKSIRLKVKNVSGADSITRVGYINVLPSPAAPKITTSRGSVLCDNDSTLLSTDATSNFVWFKNNILTSQVSTNFYQKEEGLFFVRVTGANGCRAMSNQVFLESGITPNKPIVSKDLTGNGFCDGGSFNLTSSASSNNQWFINDTLYLGETNKVLNYNDAGEFKVQVSDKGCVIFSDSILIAKLPKPVTSEISGVNWAVKGDTATFSVTPGLSGSIFNWTLSGGSLQSGSGSSAVVVKFNTVASAVVNVQENASNGCKGLTKTINISLVNTGLSQLGKLPSLKIWPNPSSEILKIELELVQSSEFTFAVYNSLGQKVKVEEMESTANGRIKSLNVATLPKGVYFIKVKYLDGEFSQTFMKE
ncbi:MAG: S8 family serine peptidase [bacterium]|nr:S8 family serine peptidase [bacterium]